MEQHEKQQIENALIALSKAKQHTEFQGCGLSHPDISVVDFTNVFIYIDPSELFYYSKNR